MTFRNSHGHVSSVAVCALLLVYLLDAVCGADAREPPVSALAISVDGREVVIGSQSGLRVQSLPDLTAQRTLDSTLEQVHDLAFAPSGRLLAAVGGVPAQEGRLEVFNWPAGERLFAVSIGDDLAYSVDWQSDEEALVVAGFDGTTRVIDGASGEVRQLLAGHSRPVTAVCTLPGKDPHRIVTGSIDQTIRVWDLSTGGTTRTLHNHTQAVHALARRPVTDSGLPLVVSVSDDRTVRFWQPTIGRMVRFVRLPAVPLCVTWLPDGSEVAVGCDDGHLRRIDPQTAEVTDDLAVAKGALWCLDVARTGEWFVGAGADGRVHLLPIAVSAGGS